MSKQTRARHPIYNLPPTEIEGFDSLAELALDCAGRGRPIRRTGLGPIEYYEC